MHVRFFFTQLLESPSTHTKIERNIAVWDSDMVICKPCFLRVHRFHQPYHRYHLSEYFKQGQHSCGKNPWKKIRENSVLPTLSGKKKRFISGAFPIFPPTQWQNKSPQNRYPEHPHKNWRIRPRRKVTCAAKGGFFTTILVRAINFKP